MKSVDLCAIAFLLLSFSCNTTDPPPPPQYVRSIELSAEDASCTEAWLRVRITDGSQPPFDIRLTRDDQTLQTYRLSTPDSLLLDEGLLPNQEYTYKAYRLAAALLTDSTTLQSVTTMDTSSSNWVFDPPVLLGDGSSSVLYDVAIINDTLAYAVGEIYKRDSLGNWDPWPYNLVKWDGNTWELKRVTVTHRGSPIMPPLNAIFAFSATDIWLSSGVPIHGNGINWTQYHLFDMGILTQNDGSINKIWGSASDLWFVGNRGTIVHRSTSGTWRRIESGTTVTLNDVWGGSNRWVGENVVLVAAGNKYTAGETKLVRINPNGTLDTLSWPSPIRTRQSIWFNRHAKAYTCGSGVFSNNGKGWRLADNIPAIYTNSIRGNGDNDVVVGGDFGLFGHFNGLGWQVYSEVALSGGNYEAVDVRNNMVMAVGWVGSRGVAVRGTRQ